jgi:hypothetical protein
MISQDGSVRNENDSTVHQRLSRTPCRQSDLTNALQNPQKEILNDSNLKQQVTKQGLLKN